MREENKKVGLILNASVVPGINLQNGEILMYLWFSGDTETHKEEIKSLGYHWDECKNADRYYSLSLKREMCWGKRIEAKDFEEEIKKAEEIGAKKFVPDAGLFGSMHRLQPKNIRSGWRYRKNLKNWKSHRCQIFSKR